MPGNVAPSEMEDVLKIILTRPETQGTADFLQHAVTRRHTPGPEGLVSRHRLNRQPCFCFEAKSTPGARPRLWPRRATGEEADPRRLREGMPILRSTEEKSRVRGIPALDRAASRRGPGRYQTTEPCAGGAPEKHGLVPGRHGCVPEELARLPGRKA